jgi:hypothetical protein
MTIQNLDFVDMNYGDELMRHLRENVFHVTTSEAYERISRDGFIFHNKDDKYSINTGSVKSFGRHNGWVCLFDLRDKTDKEIEDALVCYYFLGPHWFTEYYSDYTERNIVYLILSPECFQNLVPNEEARKVWKTSSNYTQYIPKFECWYPGNLPLSCVQKVLIVRIRESAPKDDPFLYMHHQLAVEEQQRRKSG